MFYNQNPSNNNKEYKVDIKIYNSAISLHKKVKFSKSEISILFANVYDSIENDAKDLDNSNLLDIWIFRLKAIRLSILEAIFLIIRIIINVKSSRKNMKKENRTK